MSVERSFEAWEEVQRHGQDLADKLAQGFTGLIHSHITPPSFSWPNPHPPKLFDVDFSTFDVEFPTYKFVGKDFGLPIDNHRNGINGVSAIFDIGSKLGQVGADFGACLNGVVQQFFRRFPVPFRNEHNDVVSMRAGANIGGCDLGVSSEVQEDLGSLAKRFRDFESGENSTVSDGVTEEEVSGFNCKTSGNFGRSQGTLNFSSTYDSRRGDVESSLVAKGDLWRVEASHGSSTSGNDNSSLFLVQLGPVLFVRDSTLLLPVHLSKQHLLWYGYDRKNGMHSLCPAVWSKHRRWLLMSMICLNPLACSFMDLQFPNGQFTYVAGEGLSTSAFLPLCGGLLQAQGQYPGEMRFSFSCKNKWGTRITPVVQWPDKSFSMGLAQALAWKRSGLLVRPTVQFSLCPTVGGSNPGVRAELVHSLREELSVICGCALVHNPSAFASISVGRSKWNGNVGSSGIVVRIETPLDNVGSPSFSVQLNSGIEF
ncbi:hypothetical protein LguiA_023005 [Lonicera macranthoides]